MPVVGNRFLQFHMFFKIKLKGDFFVFQVLYSTLLHLPPSDSTVLEDAGIDPRTVTTIGSQQRL